MRLIVARGLGFAGQSPSQARVTGLESSALEGLPSTITPTAMTPFSHRRPSAQRPTLVHRLLKVTALITTLISTLVAPVLGGAQTTAQPSAPTITSWPDKPLRIVLPFPPGGPSDMSIRLAAEKMQVALKQTVVVDNKPGASGNIGAAEVSRAAPDGSTWMWAPDTMTTVNPHVFKRLPYRPDDLVPVTIGTRFSQVLVCHPQSGIKTLRDLMAKARGGEKLMYASGGAGVPGHLSMELLQSMGGFSMVHVPYKGPALAMQDVMGHQVPCGFLAGPTVLPQIRAGKLVALAVSGVERSPLLPDVPTVAQAGVAGYASDFSLAMWAPKGTPEAIVQKMRDAMADALRQPDVVEKLRASDQSVVVSTPSQAAATLAADQKKWGDVARRINLGLD